MERVIKLFNALSDKTRLQIYLLLLEGDLCVCELGNILNIEQSRISHGLRTLREANLIKNKREGRWIIYSVNPQMANNEIIQGLKEEVKLNASDRRKVVKCKGGGIREKCGVG